VVSITVTPTADDPNATIMVNGVVVSSGNASLPISLSIGNNVITTIVTAADGVTTQTYMVTVNRAAALSSDATLSGLTINPGSISPAFDPQTQNYTASVGNGVSSVSITPATADPYATVTINGVPVLSGSPGSFLLSVGLNVFTVTVTAQDGSTLVYTITITRATGLIIVNNAFTPNGDGVNDTWTIQNINNYPDCTVKIFNRGGQIIYSSVGYGVAWDGTYNGRSLPTGTYYYIIDLNHNQGVTAGFVSIIR
jgi:gliding motility-associated-like protein